MNNITEEDKKILEQFPEYISGEPYVGTRDYWESVFQKETNRDPKLHEAFSELHTKLVNEVIQFCKEHDLDVDEFTLSADGLLGSKAYGEWCPCTDSFMEMRIMNKEAISGLDWYVDRDGDPFLYEI